MCLGLAEALGARILVRRVRPRGLYRWLAPWGPADPRDPGFGAEIPELLIASGRRAIPALRAAKRASGGRSFAVVLKDPRTRRSGADLVWAPAHDGLSGPDVVSTLTGPHLCGGARLEAARRAPDPRLAGLPRPLVAVLVGGVSRHVAFGPADVTRFLAELHQLRPGVGSLAVTLSRRTPPALAEGLRRLAATGTGPIFLYEGAGDNPYLSMLASADAILVTADSVNMLDEAVATGAPVFAFRAEGGHPRLDRHLEGLVRHGAVRPFKGRLEEFAYDPLDNTPIIAAAVRERLQRHRAADLRIRT